MIFLTLTEDAMKRFSKALLTAFAVLMLVLSLPISIFAEDTEADATPTPTDVKTISEENLEDNLEQRGDTNWYRFEMTEKGDAVILFRAKMKGASGYTYNWKATVYSSDMEPIEEDRKLKSFKYLTVINLKALEAGEYYVHIEETNFDKDPYDIAVVRCYYSKPVTFEHDGVQIFSETNQIIGQIDGTYFIKVGEGTAYGVFHNNKEGALLPLLISEDKNAVSFVVSTTEQVSEASSGSYNIRYNGTTYHYSRANWMDKYSDNNSPTNAPYHHVSGISISAEGERFMKHVFNQLEKQEKGMFMYIVSNYWYWPLIIAAVIGGIIVFRFLTGGLSSSSDDEYSGGSSTYTLDPDSVTYKYGSDMDTINRINDKINSPGYDMAGFDNDRDNISDWD